MFSKPLNRDRQEAPRDTKPVDLPAQFTDGRTDLVFDLVPAGHPPDSLLQTCAYFGDVSAIRFLLGEGASLDTFGPNLDLNGAAFHGHWRLCQFLLALGADPNAPLPDTGETPLHAALCTTERVAHNRVLKILLGAGANPNIATIPGAETGGFMRDVRTRGETPLHRAAAFGDEEAIRLLIDAGAALDARDVNGDSPLTWGSWHVRPAPILRLLCYGPYRIHPANRPMQSNLQGDPHV